MKLEFYYHKEESNKEEVAKILNILEKLKKKGVTYATTETSKLTEEERARLYIKAITPSVHRKYKIRKVFGTNRQSGFLFGKKVPALLVYERGEFPTDIYPHIAYSRIVRIEEFLKNHI